MPKMRRHDRAASVEQAWEILENAEFMTLSMMGAEGVPYGVTLSFARVGGSLYFHCANEGYKLDSLRKNPAVCVNALRQQRQIGSAVTQLAAVALGQTVAQQCQFHRFPLPFSTKIIPHTAALRQPPQTPCNHRDFMLY